MLRLLTKVRLIRAIITGVSLSCVTACLAMTSWGRRQPNQHLELRQAKRKRLDEKGFDYLHHVASTAPSQLDCKLPLEILAPRTPRRIQRNQLFPCFPFPPRPRCASGAYESPSLTKNQNCIEDALLQPTPTPQNKTLAAKTQHQV